MYFLVSQLAIPVFGLWCFAAIFGMAYTAQLRKYLIDLVVQAKPSLFEVELPTTFTTISSIPSQYFHSFFKLLFIVVFLAATPFLVGAQVSGTVFRDFNGNGTKDTHEPGVASVTVRAYNSTGTQLGTTATSAATTGAWSITTGTTATVRVEFQLPTTNSNPVGPLAGRDFSALSGSTYGSSVQFVAGNASGVNYAIMDPADYWDIAEDHRYVTSCFVNGLTTGTAANDAAVVSTPSSSTGLNAAYQNYQGTQGTGPNPSMDAIISQTGSVWGAAYYKSQRHFYFSTFLKRHCGLADGPGFIYNFDYSGTTPSYTGKFNLQGATPVNGGANIDLGSVTRTGTSDFTLPSNKTTANVDLDAFAKVGAISFGDIDMQPGTGYLWAVNLFQKALVRIDVSGNPTSLPADVSQYILSTLPGYPTITTGTLRPWALSFNAGKGYLGVVADASTSQNDADLRAYVLQFDPNNIAAGFTQVLNFDPNIKRGSLIAREKFHYWLNTYAEPPVTVESGGPKRWHTQPVLSDIEFDGYGNMVLSFHDRFAHQIGYINYTPVAGSTTVVRAFGYGELLKACTNGTGWDIEGTGGCHTGGEFIQDIAGDNETESSQGAIAILKGKNQLMAISIDPHPNGSTGQPYWNTQGANTYDLTTGTISNWYSVYYSAGPPLYGKTNGLGDVEFVVDAAPIEIGNRVWNDTDKDGVQDAGEAGMSNIKLELKQGSTVIANTTTSASGGYYFKGDNLTLTTTGSPANRVASTADDARQSGTDVTSTFTNMVFNNRYLGLRFQNVTVPPGATITSANIRFTTMTAGTISNVGIRGNKVANATSWVTGATSSDISNRYNTSATTASTTWNNGNTWVVGASGADQTTPDLSSIIAEIIAVGGWASGNSMAFMLNAPANTGGASAVDFSGNSAQAAVLTISYTLVSPSSSSIDPNTTYTICIPMSQTPIASSNYLTTVPNNDPSAGGDARDSDATEAGGYAQIQITTGAAGQTNHDYDFGFVACPTITNPSAAQTVCLGATGANLTVNTSTNAANIIRFVRFNTDQTAVNGAETSSEKSNIYAGTAIANVTPIGGSSPYTATYTYNPADFPSPGTYYIYAILNPTLESACRPVQEIIVHINNVTASTISGDQAVCPSDDPAAFTVTAAASGAGFLTYQWQSSTTGCAGTFSNIAGALSATYNPAPGLNATTNYRVVVTSTLNGQTCSATSNCVTITVNSITASFTQSAATCTGFTPNNNGTISLSATSGANRYGISAGAIYTGPAYASATAIGALPSVIQSNVPNIGGAYTVRLFNNSNTCYRDVTVSAAAVDCTSGGCSAGNLGGSVWADLDADGTKDAAETGVFSDITVKVYDCNGNLVATDVSNSSGQWWVDDNGFSYPVRVEFSNIPSYAYATLDGANSKTSVQFVSASSCVVDLGVQVPADYCDTANPLIGLSCFEPGNAMYGGTGNLNKGIIAFPYNTSGAAPCCMTEVAKIHQVGTVWGMGYQARHKRMFTSATLIRHMGLGPQGLGGVYVMDYMGGLDTLVSSFSLQGVSPANGGAAIDLGSVNRTGTDYQLPNDNTSSSWDIDAFDKIGKVGFGDADVSQDGNTLWLVNLNQRALISVDITSTAAYPGTVNQYLLSNATGLPSCTNGVLRPWGLGFENGKGYLGCMCTGEGGGTDANLQAYVLSFDPANPTAFTAEVSFPLNYVREKAVDFTNIAGLDYQSTWHRWASTWAQTGFNNSPISEVVYAQPILSDIDFLTDGSMVLGLADRFGFQLGFTNYIPVSGVTVETGADAAGDILKLCKSGSTWVMEGAGCAEDDDATKSALGTDGPSGTGEFFYGDGFDDTNQAPTWNHGETALGSLGVLKGINEVTATHYDPSNGFNFSFDIGMLWHNATTGARADEFRIVDAGPAATKGNGLGDFEFVCAPAPKQIGNYVWIDTDKDGVQDPCEAGLNGVKVNLYKLVSGTATLVATTTTATVNGLQGAYYFKDYQQYGSGFDTLMDNTLYYVVLGETGGTYDWSTINQRITIGGVPYGLTTQNTGEGTSSDLNDSDAFVFATAGQPYTSYPVDTVTIGYAGYINHSLDFGLVPCHNITNPSAAQTICAGSAGSNMTVSTTTNAANSIRFVRFTADQMVGSTPTPAEAAAIYTGTVISTVTPSGGAAPYTATYNFNTSDFPSGGSTYYVYAILNPDDGAVCRPTQEITVTVNPAATANAGAAQTVCTGGTVTLAGSVGGSATSSTWSAPSGTFSNASSLTSTYTPSITNGTVTLTLTTNDPAGPCPAATSTVVITVRPTPAATFTQTAPTCSVNTANNNGIITFATATNVTNFGISMAGATSYNGPAYPATSFTAVGQNVSTAIPNTGGTYIVRVFNGGAGCFTDETVTVAAVSCVCMVNLTPTVIGCYQNGGISKATVSVEVSWANATVSPIANNTTDIITVTFAGQTKTINPGAYTSTGGNGTIVSPQVVAFEVNADASTQTIQAFFGASYAASTCKDEQTGIVLPAACPPINCSVGQTGGQVYFDYNSDGIKQTGETQGLAGVTVKAYDCNGVEVGTTTTNASGKYFFTGLTPANYPIRVEFSGLLTLYGQGTPNGTDGRTTTQVITAADCNVDLGVLNHLDYCQTTPDIYIPCFVKGNPIPGSVSGNMDAFVKLQYGATGTTPAITEIANAGQVGTLWGVAYDKKRKKIYSSTFLRRHSGLGPQGLGGIYVTDEASAATVNLINVESAPLNISVGSKNSGEPFFGVTNASRGLLPNLTPSNDTIAFANIGKIGMGDLEISENSDFLYFVNLFDKKLYKLDITGASPTLSASYTIPDPCASGTGQSRPFALKIKDEKVYVGLVCDAQISQSISDSRAYIYVLDETTGTFGSAPAFDFPLTYPKGFVLSSFPSRSNWNPWTDNFNQILIPATRNLAYPQPILTDIEFDIDGSMVLAFSDRTAIQGGSGDYDLTGTVTTYFSYAGGDILRAANLGGVYSLENNAYIGGITGSSPNNNQGPGSGEFYTDDFYYLNGQLGHSEITLGGLALRPGSGQTLFTTMDPINTNINAGGFRYISNTTGTSPTGNSIGAQLYQGGGTYAKSVGLGDIELSCGIPNYLQIGNYVWIDADKDGVQDPCETPLSGVKVALYKDVSGTLTYLANTTTGSNGEYYFTGLGAPNENWTATAGKDSLLPNMNYKVVFGWDGTTSQFSGNNLTVSGFDYQMTVVDSGEGSNPDMNDSDASLMTVAGNSYPSISVTTGSEGSVNHTLDAGFWNCPTITNPSPTQPICIGSAGSNITVNTSYNTTSGIRFVRFTSNQSATNGSETALELANIYAGTAISTVTPTGGSAPYTATYTWNSADFPNATSSPITYYVYAILNIDQGASCRPVQEIIITVNPAATANAGSAQAVCAGGTVTLAGSVGGSASSGTWSASSGTFSNAASLTSTYTPSITSGTVTLTLTTNDPAGPCPAATSTMVITVNPKPDFTLDLAAVCPGDSPEVSIGGLTNGTPATSTMKINTGSFVPYADSPPNLTTAQGIIINTTNTVTVRNELGCETPKNIAVPNTVPLACPPANVTKIPAGTN